jgi:protein-S-isoprenylcysteine O-methyltransferase Ste14
LVHYLLAIFFGSAILAAIRIGQASPSWLIRLPSWMGISLMFLSGAIILLVVFNLALKGLGAPFGIALTRLVVSDWLYAWTRNPMVLSALAFLVGLGLWFQSGLFLVWVLVVVSPAILWFLKVYEERELEIRFGSAYLDYKSRTPMILPRRPRK